MGGYIEEDGWRETQESLSNLFKTLGNILDHFPSPPLIPKFDTLHWRTKTLDFVNGLRLYLKHRLMRHPRRESPWSNVNPLILR